MKKLILSVFMIIVVLLNTYSQTGDKTITLKKRRYFQNDLKLTDRQLKDILINNPASAPEFKKYKATSSIAMPFLVVGSAGCLAGGVISLASSIKQTSDINNGKLNGTYANALPIVLVAGAITIVGIVFIIPATNHFKKSISDYNSSIKTTGYEPVQFNLMVNSNGLGIRMRF